MIDAFFVQMEGRPSGNTQLAGNSTEIAPAAATNRIGSDPIRTEGQNLNPTQMEIGGNPHQIGSDPIRTATLHELGGSSLPSGNQDFVPARPTSAPVRIGNPTQLQHQAPRFGTGDPDRIGTSDPNRAPLHNPPRFSEPQQGGTSEPNRMTCQAPYTLPHSSELNAGGTSSGLVNLQQLFEGDRLANLIERLSRGRTYQNDMDDVNHNPFTQEIRNSRNPPDFKLPQLEPYNGRADPTVHLMRYKRHMEVQSASENVMAKCFPLFLADITSMWIRQLETESIYNWNMLVARFLEQFRVHIARPKNVMSLTAIKQRPRETPRSFLERSNVAAASVIPLKCPQY